MLRWWYVLSDSPHTTLLPSAFHFFLHYNASFNFLCMKRAPSAVPSITRPVNAPFFSIRVLHANRLFEFRISAIESCSMEFRSIPFNTSSPDTTSFVVLLTLCCVGGAFSLIHRIRPLYHPLLTFVFITLDPPTFYV